MTKKLFSVFLLAGSFAFAQVGVNTQTPQATLDVVGNPTDTAKYDGIIAPRITGDQLKLKTYSSSQTGALVYVTSADSGPSGQTLEVTSPGYYYFDGTLWKLATGNDWHTTGNTGTVPGTNFIGTSDDKALMFKVNNTIGGFIDNVDPTASSTNGGNTALGKNALASSYNVSKENTAIGNAALFSLDNTTTNYWNTAIGAGAMKNSIATRWNTAIGANALANLNTGNRNIAVGISSLSAVGMTGSFNVAIGSNASDKITSGNQNIAVGLTPLNSLTSGSGNIGLGYFSGLGLTTGNNNIAIGQQTQVFNVTGDGQINIGNVLFGSGASSNSAVDPSKKIGVNLSAAPHSTLQVGGSLSMAYATPNSGNVLLDETYYTVRVFNGNTGITLPDASTCKGRIYILIGSNGISTKNISVSGGSGIYDDVTNTSITSISSNQRIQIQSDGTGWIVIGR